jgi:hypothetical protein
LAVEQLVFSHGMDWEIKRGREGVCGRRRKVQGGGRTFACKLKSPVF